MSKLLDELLCEVEASTGGAETRVARAVTARRFCEALAEANHRPISIDQVKTGAVMKFISAMRASGLAERTIHNRVAHLRALLPARVFKGFTNARLGLQATSRAGTKRPITEAELRERLAGIRDPGCRAAVELQRALGLRAQESIRSAAQLKDWQRQLERGQAVVVSLGTKGGRVRHVWPSDRERALRAVREAIVICKRQGGHLVVGACRTDRNGRPTSPLRSAMTKLENATRRAGFVGEISQHSNRYAFAAEQVRAYQADGYERRDASTLTSQDLGHGDGRGTYVDRVYVQRS